MPGTEFQANASGNTELASQLQASITALVAAQAQAGNLSSSLQPLASVTNEGSVQLPTLDTNALTQTITQISTAYESIESSFAKLSTKLPEIQKQLDQLSNIKLPENAMSQLKDNVDKINAGMKVLDQGLTTVSKNMGLLDKSTDSLSAAADGINTLLGGFKQLNGYNQSITRRSIQIESKQSASRCRYQYSGGRYRRTCFRTQHTRLPIMQRIGTLAANSAALRDGASTLLSGTTELSKGGTILQNGSKQVKTESHNSRMAPAH